jgi:hypothetical protein
MTAQDSGRARPALSNAMVCVAAAATAALCLYVFAAGSTVAAPPNELLNGNVNPNSGTTTTTFDFFVRYDSGQDNKPTSVTAVAGNVIIPLRLIAGTAADGRYRGSAKLPAGRWLIMFQATAHGNDPSLDGPTVTVTKSPKPSATARPTPRATARPTPVPTPPPTVAPRPSAAPQTTAPTTPAPATSSPTRRPRSAGPAATPRETGLAGGGLTTPAPKATADPAAGGGTDAERQLVTILIGGLIAIGALALIGMFAVLRDRRRRSRDARLELLPEGAATQVSAAPRPARTPRAPTAWERDYALDEEPIGTVEYQLPPVADDEGS